MARKKVVRPEKAVADPDRKPSYHAGGRAPMTDVKLVPLTVVLDGQLYDEVKTLSDRFINPKLKKPYGISSVVRIIVEIGLSQLKSIKEKDLLYYVGGDSKGAVGRWPLSSAGVFKMSILLPRSHVVKINERIEDGLSKIVGTTTLIRYLIRQTVGEVRDSDLYARIPESHLEIMSKENLTPRKLQAIYKASQKG